MRALAAIPSSPKPLFSPSPSSRFYRTLATTLFASTLLSCGADVIAPVGALEEGQAGRWTTLPPEALSVAPSVLREMEREIDTGRYGEISSVLLLRSGTLVYERYWGTWGPDDLHPVYSVTKSVSSLAFGIARADDLIPSLDTPLLDVLDAAPDLPERMAKEEITLRHVLQMRAGFAWDELSSNYTDGANPTAALAGSEDWIEYVLELPMAADAGEAFSYNSGVSMLMSALIEQGTGETTEDFTADRLFEPLGIDRWTWTEGPNDLTNTGWGLWLLPRDMAALGEMVRLGGLWEGEQLVPGSWIGESREDASRFTDGTGYGYQWWLPAPDGGERPMAAWGYGNQFIVVVPSLDVVMVATGSNFGGGGWTPYQMVEYAYRAVAP